ncbi:alpha/beta hydrolase family protein [Catenuloplanes indicus]|uniref:Dienelactone hydrolase n=1 Tax=Catenuloplanes indicus TaxID=137267 RepID=A0AAE3VZM0_9ACTN|nr:chlorophyllase [Catenuloplanes indicus]MDQ0366635.1 dienelactone hydrolase [Catenuloplanes indicus]
MTTSTPNTVLTIHPVILPAPERGDDLQVRISAPATGGDLPVIVFSHGYHQSAIGYGPLVDHWAANGFAVIQPTHLDSLRLGLAPDDPRTPDIWRTRIDDVTRVLDNLDVLEAAIPGRFDRDRIAVAGHSWGAQTVGVLLGAGVVGMEVPARDPRISAGVLLAATGTGGDDLTPFAAEHFPFMSPDFAGMTTPALIVAGDKDQSMLSVRGPEWFTDVYHLSPAPKSLLTVYGGEHSLGGIAGYAVTETTDENPERVAFIQRVTTAYLRGETLPGSDDLGRIESK